MKLFCRTAAIACLATGLGGISRAEEIQPERPNVGPTEDIGLNIDYDARNRLGYYFRAGGMILEPTGDGRINSTDEDIELDTGGGFSLAAGYLFPEAPISLEIETAFRRVDAGVDGDVTIGALALNLMLDKSDLIGPVGGYVGGGVGVRIDSISVRSTSFGATDVQLNGDGFFGQLRAGLTLSVSETAQVYTGVNWSDSGTLGNDDTQISSELVGLEFGLRFFF